MKKNRFGSWVVLGIFLLTLGMAAIPNEARAATIGSIAGTSTTNAADSLSFQRKSFFANTRFYVFYSDGANMTYRTSLNGIDWNTPASPNIRACASGDQFSVWFDGTYVHYAFSTGVSGTHVYYRRGTPNGGGNITWGAEVVAVPGVSGVICSLPSISVDSTKSAWIGYRRIQSGNLYAYVAKNKNTNGTWAPASGFPYNLSSYSAAAWVATPVPLDSGKVVAIYGTVGQVLRARSWNGSAWVGGFTTVNAGSWIYFSAVGKGDDVHLAFLNTSAIVYTKYNFTANTLGAEEVAQGGVTATSGPVLTLDSLSGDLHLFWAGAPAANRIYYKQNAGGKWDAAPLNLVDESSETLSGNGFLTSPYASGTEGKAVFYLTKAAKPFNVKSSRGSASLSISKSGPAAAYLGDKIVYNFILTNNGKVALNNVSVSDNLLGPIGSSIATFPAGSSVPFTANYTVKNTDPNPLVNTVTAQGTYGSAQITDSDSWSVKVTNPLEVKKSAPKFVFDGSQITYTMTVKNVWNKDLTITSVADNLGTPTGPTGDNGDGKLNPGETWTYTLTIPTPGNMSPLVNTVTVAATGEDRQISGTATCKMFPILIKKDVVGVNDDTDFGVYIKDSGKIPYPDPGNPFKISETRPKKIWLSEGTHWFKEVILYPNCYRLVPNDRYVIKYYPQYNSEFAEFQYAAGKENWNEITFYNKNYCQVCLTKTGPAQDCVGDKITYNFKVTNCSEIPQNGDQPDLYNVAVTDPLLGLNKSIGTLAPGASSEFTYDYVPQAAGPLVNTATATGKHQITYDGIPSTTKTVTAQASFTVSVEECRRGQICGFKFDDFNGDGHWTKCDHIIFFDQFDSGNLENWVPIPSHGNWVVADGFLKQTDQNAAYLNDALIFYGLGDESKKYHALSYRTAVTPIEGNADFGVIFYAQDATHFYLFRVDALNQKVGVFRRNGTSYETIIDMTFADARINFPVVNGKVYGITVNTYFESNKIAFYFDEIEKFAQNTELYVFDLPVETFGCVSGYLGLRTNLSAVNFDWVFQSAEVGIEGWQINLTGPANATAYTRPDGAYCFTNLPPGTYTVSEVIQPGWGRTFPPNPGTYEISLAPGQAVGCVNFGNTRVVSISGYKYADCNADGQRSEGEYGLVGWKISLFKQDGANWVFLKDVLTEPDGYYAFEGLEPGVYKVAEEIASGWENTVPGDGEYIITVGGSPIADLNFGNRWAGTNNSTVEFVGFDTTTGGFWQLHYGSCFYALPNPGSKKDPEWTVGPGWYSGNVGQYNYVDQATGATLAHEVGAINNPNWAAQFDFRVFDYDNGNQTNAFAWPSKAIVENNGVVKNIPANYPSDPCDAGSGNYYALVGSCGAQYKPSLDKYFAVTWDSDLFSKEPLIAEVLIQQPGIYRVTFNVINPNDLLNPGPPPFYYEGQRDQDFWLWINGNDAGYNKSAAVWSGHRDRWTGSIYLSFMITAETPITVALGAQLTNYCPGAGCPKNAYISGVFVDCICGPQFAQPNITKTFELTVTNPDGTPDGVTYWATLTKGTQNFGPVQLMGPDQSGKYTGAIPGLIHGTYHYRFYYKVDSQEATIQEGDETLNESKTNTACRTWQVDKTFEMTVTNPEHAPPAAHYWLYFTNAAHGGSFGTTVEFTGGPPVYSIAFPGLVAGLYDWAIYATFGDPAYTYPISAGTEKLTYNVTNKPQVTWPEHYCTRTAEYWQAKPAEWPEGVDSLTLGMGFYSKVQLLMILGYADPGNSSNGLVSLAHQLIAAKLNVDNGAWPPAGIQWAISNADFLIDGHMIPPWPGSLDPSQAAQAQSLAMELENYNQGVYPNGPPLCQ